LTFWDMVARDTPPTSHLGFENERLRRFGVAMRAVGNVHPVYEVLNGEIAVIFRITRRTNQRSDGLLYASSQQDSTLRLFPPRQSCTTSEVA
jgi:hypothetical protein